MRYDLSISHVAGKHLIIADTLSTGQPTTGDQELQHDTAEGVVMRGSRVVIPTFLRQDMLHTGHQGITKCHKMARQSVWPETFSST